MIVVASQTGRFLYFFIVCRARVQTQNLDTFYHWTAFPTLTEILVFMIPIYKYLKSTQLSILFHLNFRILKQNNGKQAVNQKHTKYMKKVTKILPPLNY